MIHIHTYTTSYPASSTPRMQIDLSGEHIEMFKQLINRAMNTWDRAPAELKAFADMVTEGEVLQDYSTQS